MLGEIMIRKRLKALFGLGKNCSWTRIGEKVMIRIFFACLFHWIRKDLLAW